MPWARTPAAVSAAARLCAPSCVVAVPTTVAPARPSFKAIAAPMPREAPVTRATSDSSIGFSRTASAGSGNGCGQTVRVLQCIAGRGPLDAPVEPRQYLSRSALDEHRGAGKQGAHRGRPAHRACQLAHQRRTNVGGLDVLGTVHGTQIAE